MKKTRVLFLITKSNWGGAQRYVFDIATGLPQDRFETAVVVGGSGPLVEKLESAGITVFAIKNLQRDISLRKELAASREIFSFIKQFKPDVLHINSSKAGGIGAFLGRCARVPRIIFTAHGWAFNEDRPRWQRLVIKFLHWITVLLAHQTIAVSKALAAQLNWPGATSKMTVVYLGHSLNNYYEHPVAREKLIERAPELSAVAADPWIMTVGELHPIKRQSVLLEALSHVRDEFPQLRCVIIGEGSERPKLEAEIDAQNLAGTVFLLGHVPEAAMYMKAADLFVLPSKSEAGAYVVTEAGAAAVPVAASAVGGIPETIFDKKTGQLFPPDKPNAIADCIRSFMKHPDRWQSYAHELHELVKERTTSKMVEETIQVYSANNSD